MIVDHLPVLQVIVPLIGAPLCAATRNARVAFTIATLACAAALVIAWQLLQQVLATGPVSYALGGWVAPAGIEYRLDAVNAFVALIVAAIGALAMPYSARSAAREIDPARLPLFYAACLLCIAGLLGITVTGDAFNLFVFLEISSLSSYILISFGRDRRALTASFQYLVMGTIGATFILIGIGLCYMMTGTLNMADLAVRLADMTGTRTVQAAFAFITVGIGLKLAMFPLHLWLPNAYTYAPSAVTVLLSATATKVAVYMLMRFAFTVFGVRFAFATEPLGVVIGVLGLAGVLSGSFVAIFQDDVKRMLAYSSVAQVGYMILGVGLASLHGLTAALLHMFNHALMKGALFMAIGALVYRVGRSDLRAFAGLGRRMPWTFAAVVVGGLSLIGVPLTAGFVSKWYLVLAALHDGLWPVAILVLVGSLLAVIYVWRIIEAAYFQPAPADAPAVREAPWSMLVPTWLLVIANIWFGIDTRLTVGAASRAAGLLLGATP